MYGKKANLKICPFCGCELKRNWDSDGMFYEHPDNGCVIFADRLKGSKDYKNWNDRRGVKISELEFLKAFAQESCFDNELCRDQLRSLWTAYCFHHNHDVDTREYDVDLQELWEVIDESDCADWHDYSTFYDFMCGYFVLEVMM